MSSSSNGSFLYFDAIVYKNLCFNCRYVREECSCTIAIVRIIMRWCHCKTRGYFPTLTSVLLAVWKYVQWRERETRAILVTSIYFLVICRSSSCNRPVDCRSVLPSFIPHDLSVSFFLLFLSSQHRYEAFLCPVFSSLLSNQPCW